MRQFDSEFNKLYYFVCGLRGIFGNNKWNKLSCPFRMRGPSSSQRKTQEEYTHTPATLLPMRTQIGIIEVTLLLLYNQRRNERQRETVGLFFLESKCVQVDENKKRETGFL